MSLALSRDADPSASVRERLVFIDFRCTFLGELRRADLMSRFHRAETGEFCTVLPSGSRLLNADSMNFRADVKLSSSLYSGKL